MTTRSLARLVLGMMIAAVSGCGDEGATEQAAEQPTGEPTAQVAPGAAATPAAAAVTTAAAPQPDTKRPTDAQAQSADGPWTVPQGWTKESQPRPMRIATFIAGEGDNQIEIAVSQFPGDVGGLLANVNRWRQQIGLEPITEADLPSVVEPFENPGYKGHTMHLKGPSRHMLAAAITDEQANAMWFVKATTTPAQAEAHAADVKQFARSFGAGQSNR